MKFAKAAIIGILVMLSVSSVSMAATVGYIDVKLVFEGYNKTKDAQKQINDKMKDYEKLRNKHMQKISDARIDGKDIKALEKLEDEMKKELDPKETELNMLNEDLMARIRKDIVSAVEEVSKEVGIDVIVDKQVIIWGGLDLTDSVITRLNRKK